MDCGPYWVVLPIYGSHDVRHVDFHGLTVVNETPGFGRHNYYYYFTIFPENY